VPLSRTTLAEQRRLRMLRRFRQELTLEMRAIELTRAVLQEPWAHDVSLRAALRMSNTWATARRVRWCVWRMLVDEGWSYAGIGRAYGCDHTTVMHAASRLAA